MTARWGSLISLLGILSLSCGATKSEAAPRRNGAAAPTNQAQPAGADSLSPEATGEAGAADSPDSAPNCEAIPPNGCASAGCIPIVGRFEPVIADGGTAAAGCMAPDSECTMAEVLATDSAGRCWWFPTGCIPSAFERGCENVNSQPASTCPMIQPQHNDACTGEGLLCTYSHEGGCPNPPADPVDTIDIPLYPVYEFECRAGIWTLSSSGDNLCWYF